jgi:DNA polymerase III subunit gamma/tau
VFENILDQQHVVARLEEDIRNTRIPSSMLFFGPAYSGKISTALELARSLGCTREAEWSCSCGDCRKHRSLTHPDLVMTGPRYFLQELDAGAEVLRRTQKSFARYLLIRSARKLTRRFDPWLWEGEESKVRKVRSSLDAIEESLDELDPAGVELPQKRIEALIATVTGEAARIVAGVNLSHIPISTVRNISAWAHTTGRGRGKTIILESAETMLDSARNALLKILEEPPEGVHLILTTPKRGALLPTIISRVRSYAFHERSSEGEREVLNRIFREPSGEYSSLRDYFLGFDLPAASMRRYAQTMVHLALGLDTDGELGDVFAMLEKKKERFLPLLEEAAKVLRGFLSSPGNSVPLSSIEALQLRLTRARRMFESYNQSPAVLLEGLLYGGAA